MDMLQCLEEPIRSTIFDIKFYSNFLTNHKTEKEITHINLKRSVLTDFSMKNHDNNLLTSNIL